MPRPVRRRPLHLAQRLARPLLAAAALAYLLVPLLYTEHVAIAHGGRLEEAVAGHFAPRSQHPPGERPAEAGHCDLCRLLASVAAGGDPAAPAAPAVFDAPVAAGTLCLDVERPFLGRVSFVALLPRAPPLV